MEAVLHAIKCEKHIGGCLVASATMQSQFIMRDKVALYNAVWIRCGIVGLVLRSTASPIESKDMLQQQNTTSCQFLRQTNVSRLHEPRQRGIIDPEICDSRSFVEFFGVRMTVFLLDEGYKVLYGRAYLAATVSELHGACCRSARSRSVGMPCRGRRAPVREDV